VIVLPLFAGCGSEATSSEQAVSDSAEKTAQAGSSRVAVFFDGSLFMTGALDYGDGTGAFAQDGGPPTIIYTQDAAYAELAGDLRVSAELEDKGWIKSDLNGGSAALFQPFAGSPTELLGFVRAASDVEKIDAGQERGVEVIRYHARLDVERAVEELAEDERDGVRAMIKQYWPDGAKAGIPLDLAIDREGRLRKVALTIPEDERLAVEFYDYGVEVDAKPPPADEVISWDDLVERMRAACESVDEQGFAEGDGVAACMLAQGFGDDE
jgi:hypothetical protein